MQRPITDYHQDDHGDWVAELACGHGQHVRHNPPFQLRPWVTTPEGRDAHRGQVLECVRCDRLEMPEGYAPYKRTPEFTNETIPAGLMREHNLKAGTWGRLTVLEGSLSFRLPSAPVPIEIVLTPAAPGSIPPEVFHVIAPLEPVRFFVEFFRRAGDTSVRP